MATMKAKVIAYDSESGMVRFEGSKKPVKVAGEKLPPLLISGTEVEFELFEVSFFSKKDNKNVTFNNVKFPGEVIPEKKFGGGGGGRPYDPTPGYKTSAMTAAVEVMRHNRAGEKIVGKELFELYDAILSKLKA